MSLVPPDWTIKVGSLAKIVEWNFGRLYESSQSLPRRGTSKIISCCEPSPKWGKIHDD